MQPVKAWIASVALALLAAAYGNATTLQRASLDDLTRINRTVVLGEVIDASAYWNSDGSYILTDVRLEVREVLKGSLDSKEPLTITLLGGTVGDRTALILGGAELVPGRSYVLFLNEVNLPGAPQVLTIRDHCQGVFEVVVDPDDALRAVSQAKDHGLVPDAAGVSLAPGGREGLPLDELIHDVRALAAGQARR